MESRTHLPYLKVYLQGLQSYRKGCWTEAVEAFNEADRLEPGHPEPGNYRVKALKELERLVAAKRVSRTEEKNTMSATRPEDEDSSKPGVPEYLFGEGFHAANNFIEAKKQLTLAAALGYKNAKLFSLLGEIEHNRGNELTALSHFQQALTVDPDYLKVHLQLGVLMRERGDYAQAEGHFDKVLESKNIHNLLALMHKGGMYFMRGDATNLSDSNSTKAESYRLAADCYKNIVDMPVTEVPPHIMLRAAVQLCRLQSKDKSLSIDVGRLNLDQLITNLKEKDTKTLEEKCILFLAQIETRRFVPGWETFLQMLELHVSDNDTLYDRIPAYLKREFFAALISWPNDQIQKVAYIPDKTDQIKLAIADLLKVRNDENYSVRVMQINAGLLALIPTSQLGTVLYVQRGSIFGPSLASGKLNQVVTGVTNGITTMCEQARAGLAGPMRICARTKQDLDTTPNKDILKSYPIVYEAVFGVLPPAPPARWFGLFGGAAQPPQRVASPTPPGVIRTGP